jgi:hypothetical protein
MKSILIVLMALILIAPGALAETTTTTIDATYCANDTYMTTNSTMYLIGMVNGSSELENESFSSDRLCVNGCSDTLGACRSDKYIEMMIVLITLAALVIFIAVANIMGPLTVAALIISATVSIIIFTTDAFSTEINSLFLILPFGILVYGCFYWYKSFMKKKDVDEDDISI